MDRRLAEDSNSIDAGDSSRFSRTMQSSVDVGVASLALAEMGPKKEVGDSFAAGPEMRIRWNSEVQSTVSQKRQHRGKLKIHRRA
jgi:hypothetical protein